LFSAQKSKQSSVLVAFFMIWPVYSFCFNVDGGERSKVILCIFPNHLIPFFMSSKILIIIYLKSHKHILLIMQKSFTLSLKIVMVSITLGFIQKGV